VDACKCVICGGEHKCIREQMRRDMEHEMIEGYHKSFWDALKQGMPLGQARVLMDGVMETIDKRWDARRARRAERTRRAEVREARTEGDNRRRNRWWKAERRRVKTAKDGEPDKELDAQDTEMEPDQEPADGSTASEPSAEKEPSNEA